MTMTMTVRTLHGNEGSSRDEKDETRSRMVGLEGGARKAMEKSWVEDGDDGVMMMAGKGDFSATRGRERSDILGLTTQDCHFWILVTHRGEQGLRCSPDVAATYEDGELEVKSVSLVSQVKPVAESTDQSEA